MTGAASQLSQLYCPYCGGVCAWSFGLVFHREVVHVRLRNQPQSCKTVQEIASIVERAMPQTIPVHQRVRRK